MPPPRYVRQQSDFSDGTSQVNTHTGAIPILPSHNGGSNSNNAQKRTVTIKQPAAQRKPTQYGNGNENGLYPTTSGGSGGGGMSSAVKRNLTRAKTLTRPDRHVTPAPLINPHQSSGAARAAQTVLSHKESWFQPWSIYISFITFWAPSAILSACGMKEPAKQRAWKEKVALCSIAILLGGFVGFATIGLNRTLCPADQGSTPDEFIRLGEQPGKFLFVAKHAGLALCPMALTNASPCPSQATLAFKDGCSAPQTRQQQSTVSISERSPTSSRVKTSPTFSIYQTPNHHLAQVYEAIDMQAPTHARMPRLVPMHAAHSASSPLHT